MRGLYLKTRLTKLGDIVLHTHDKCLMHSLVEMGHHTLLDHFRSTAKYLGDLCVSHNIILDMITYLSLGTCVRSIHT